jgi:hypothetical protein
MGRHRQVCDQFPEHNNPTTFWRIQLFGMNDLKVLMSLFLLLSDRGANRHRSVTVRQDRAMGFSLCVSELHSAVSASTQLCNICAPRPFSAT